MELLPKQNEALNFVWHRSVILNYSPLVVTRLTLGSAFFIGFHVKAVTIH